MQISAIHCRAQEAAQLALEASETLESRKKVAARAAKAWGKQAEFDELRDAKAKRREAAHETRMAAKALAETVEAEG